MSPSHPATRKKQRGQLTTETVQMTQASAKRMMQTITRSPGMEQAEQMPGVEARREARRDRVAAAKSTL
eukprot:1532418-Pleurochrysis_carterae.AAC.1